VKPKPLLELARSLHIKVEGPSELSLSFSPLAKPVVQSPKSPTKSPTKASARRADRKGKSPYAARPPAPAPRASPPGPAAAKVRQEARRWGQSQEATEQEKGDAAVLRAADLGDVTRVLAMLDAGQDINVADMLGETLVHKSCKLHDGSLCGELLRRGALADFADVHGVRPISVAIQYESIGSLTALLAATSAEDGRRAVDLRAINEQNGHSLLHDCAWASSDEPARMLLDTGELSDLLELPNKKGQTVLHVAAFRATKGFVQMLVEHGAKVDALEKTRKWIPQAPLEIAESMGRSDSAQYLRELTTAVDAVRFAVKLKRGLNK
jgi:hypothetical protein